MTQTAMQQMYDDLMAHEYTIPLELIVRCKKLIEVEKEQIVNAWMATDNELQRLAAEQYYNETYNK